LRRCDGVLAEAVIERRAADFHQAVRAHRLDAPLDH